MSPTDNFCRRPVVSWPNHKSILRTLFKDTVLPWLSCPCEEVEEECDESVILQRNTALVTRKKTRTAGDTGQQDRQDNRIVAVAAWDSEHMMGKEWEVRGNPLKTLRRIMEAAA